MDYIPEQVTTVSQNILKICLSGNMPCIIYVSGEKFQIILWHPPDIFTLH